ncbi:MAG: response regulator [Gammaproteobacteria bacterium]|nr:MAG: response regulator [Gammaproteobacteria bacterium]
MAVDDSNIIKNKISRVNSSEEFTVVCRANNGIAAIEVFKKYRPDVVTMDLTMPEMDGLECIEELIKLDEDVLILVVSSLTDKATGIEALQNGARGFVGKPFTDEELYNSLLELVE